MAVKESLHRITSNWTTTERNAVTRLARLQRAKRGGELTVTDWAGSRGAGCVTNVRCRCHGRLHVIRAAPAGPVTVLDHSKEELEAFGTLVKLGAEPPTCVRRVAALTGKRVDQSLIGGLAPQAGIIKAIREHRSHRPSQPEEPGLAERVTLFRGEMQEIMYKAQWEVPKGYPGAQDITIGYASEQIGPGVEVRYRYKAGGVDGTLSTDGTEVIAAVPKQWPLWRRNGLGALNGYIVLDVRYLPGRKAALKVAEWSESERRVVLVQRTVELNK